MVSRGDQSSLIGGFSDNCVNYCIASLVQTSLLAMMIVFFIIAHLACIPQNSALQPILMTRPHA